MNKIILTSLVALAFGAFVYFGAFANKSEDKYSTVTLSENMSDGLVNVSIRQIASMTLAIEVKLAATQDEINLLELKPEVSLAMDEMHMDGITPLFSTIGVGVWQGKVILPMVGPWVVSIGFGEEFIETKIDVR